MVRVAVLDDYQDVAMSVADWSLLPPGTEVVCFREHLHDEAMLVERLLDFEVVVGMRERTPFRRSLLLRLPNLKLLITTGMGNAVYDIDAARELGVTVCGTRGLRIDTAELTWGLIIGLVRRIAVEDRAVREGRWQVSLPPTLSGKTLGVVGLGVLGSRVAEVGRALGMDVIAWSENLTAQRAQEHGVRLVTKDELFSTADVVTVHLVLSERTRGLVGPRELGLMKRGAYFVNTSRGPIVDEAALVEALREHRIAGAALDVFDIEPLPAGHPFLTLENTLLTPHVGYVTQENYRVYFADAVEDIAAYLAGNPVRVIETQRWPR